MKRILLPIALSVVIFTSCKTEQKKEIETSRQLMLTPDTSNLYKNDASSDVAKSNDEDIYIAPKRNKAIAPKTIIKTVYVPQERPVETVTPDPIPTPPVVATIPEVIAPAPTGTGTTTPTETAAIPAPEPEKKKKGISDAAKGAAIGGVGGAVAGAIIGKNGKGAVIGGVIGAAGGYILGRQKDKKTGRVDMASN